MRPYQCIHMCMGVTPCFHESLQGTKKHLGQSRQAQAFKGSAWQVTGKAWAVIGSTQATKGRTRAVEGRARAATGRARAAKEGSGQPRKSTICQQPTRTVFKRAQKQQSERSLYTQQGPT